MSVVPGVELCAEEVEALQCAHTGGAYCYDMPEIGNDCFDGFAWYGDNLGVTGWKVPAPTCKVTSAVCMPFWRKLLRTLSVK